MIAASLAALSAAEGDESAAQEVLANWADPRGACLHDARDRMVREPGARRSSGRGCGAEQCGRRLQQSVEGLSKWA